MAAPRNLPHLFVDIPPAVERFQPPARMMTARAFPAPDDRVGHGRRLADSLLAAQVAAAARRTAVGFQIEGVTPGVYVTFESFAGLSDWIDSLDARSSKIELVIVKEVETADDPPQRLAMATVFVPDDKVGYFLKRFTDYANAAAVGKLRHVKLVDRIASLRDAVLEAFYTDAAELWPPVDRVVWWEVWLRHGRHGAHSAVDRMQQFTDAAGLGLGRQALTFEDRSVVLVRANRGELAKALDVVDVLAEVRIAKDHPGAFDDMNRQEHSSFSSDLADRLVLPGTDAPSVCVLDTGVNRGHPVLERILSPEDMHAYRAEWGTADSGPDVGHGTAMAGLSAYGDLLPVLSSRGPVHLSHRLESVKILPPSGGNPPELYGEITAAAMSAPETRAPSRPRVFELAVTAKDGGRDRGRPSSWSATLDALACGVVVRRVPRGIELVERGSTRRLVVAAAGNVFDDPSGLDRSDTEPVQDPAQAWNALTVGAFTDKTRIENRDLRTWQPVAAAGELSPYSTTSLTFDPQWPLKPEVVFEGGNGARSPSGELLRIPDLEVLTTHHAIQRYLFETANATSAASAQVARMAAQIMATYPTLWPETVRALIVHSARYRDAMSTQIRRAGNVAAQRRLRRRYGYGVPDLDRATRSARDALTLVVQRVLTPFEDGKMRDMHLFALPWPEQTLQQLGDARVRLRITLSYFVEPNPGERGWKRRHRYASHGLRFALKRPTESVDGFRQRINQLARDSEAEREQTESDSARWALGSELRFKGSIHSDVWTGTAADLAACGHLGIVPVAGWWKDQPRRAPAVPEARYALVVSIESDATNVDLWTPVATQLGVPVALDVDATP